MGFPESLINHQFITVLFKTILSRSKTNCNITRKNSRKFPPWHVISLPCLHQVLRILKSFHQFPTVLAIGVTLPSDQELPPAVSLPEVKDSLNFPLFLVINEDRCWFGMGPTRESFVIVGVVGLQY